MPHVAPSSPSTRKKLAPDRCAPRVVHLVAVGGRWYLTYALSGLRDDAAAVKIVFLFVATRGRSRRQRRRFHQTRHVWSRKDKQDDNSSKKKKKKKKKKTKKKKNICVRKIRRTQSAAHAALVMHT